MPSPATKIQFHRMVTNPDSLTPGTLVAFTSAVIPGRRTNPPSHTPEYTVLSKNTIVNRNTGEKTEALNILNHYSNNEFIMTYAVGEQVLHYLGGTYTIWALGPDTRCPYDV